LFNYFTTKDRETLICGGAAKSLQLKASPSKGGDGDL